MAILGSTFAGARGAGMKALGVLILCAITLALFRWDARYEPVATGILPNPAFEQGFRHWRGTPGGVRLDREDRPFAELRVVSDGQLSYVTQRVPVPQRFTHIKASVEIRAEAIVPGKESWQRGAVILRSVDRNRRKIWYLPFEVATAEGTSGWRRYSAVVPVLPETADMSLLIYLAARSGSLAVRGIEVDGVAEARWFAVARTILAGLWGLFVVWTVAPIAFRGRITSTKMMSLAVGAIVLGATLAPQPQLSGALAMAGSGLARVFSPASEHPTADARGTDSAPSEQVGNGAAAEPSSPKRSPPRAARADASGDAIKIGVRDLLPGFLGASFGHAAAYAVLAFLALTAFPATRVTQTIAFLAIAAVASEVLQTFTVTRTAQIGDAAMNGVGIALGAAAFAAFRGAVAARRG